MRKSYWIWLVLFLGIVVLAVVTSGGNLLWYLNLPALIMVVAPSILLSLGNFGLREIKGFFGAVFRPAEDHTTLERAILFFDSLKRYLPASGIIGGFCGAVAMLVSDDPVTIGHGAALIAVTVLYGIILYVAVAVPFATAARRRLDEASQ